MSFVDQIGRLFVSVFGSANERKLKPLKAMVNEMNRLEPAMRRLSDEQLGRKTVEFRDRLNDALKGRRDFTAEEADEALEPMLPETFAVVREASRRTVTTPAASGFQPMRHFDVQLLGGLILHRRGIAEMVTGEGKTLVATLPAYANALLGRGVHVVTVNDYLARRDRDWMAPMFELLGMTAGAIQSDQDYDAKRAAYQCDVTYGYDSEFGFDYLRDNMRWSAKEQVQLGRMYYAIVDEVDSVLIDEARTPLIISGPAEDSTEKYYRADSVARKLKAGVHFEVKEKEQTCHLTEAGTAAVERMLGVD
ncbi:MAG TPA: preprotein translocase subunit SecA, partial [Candidatus Brocadiia bacterium]|nr:preprotein translocase subunit SecA [Candidatus Brocadiia bacterium]